jgi:DNA repair exonuclease SbcCD ATPase subunit
VVQDASSLDQRITELQSQLDRLTVSLQLWREQQEHLKPAEDRLADLAHQCAQIINQVSSTGERQARAVGQLEERVSAFGAAEERLHHDAAERLRALERAIEQEWSALRQIHEEPVRELRDQADVLSRITIAATNSSVGGFERAEARLAAIETALNRRLDGVSEQLAAAVAEVRAVAIRSSSFPAVPAWPIEGVVRLHNQLRESNGSPAGAVVVQPVPGSAHMPAAAPDVFARLESVEQALADRQNQSRGSAGEARRRALKFGAAIASVLVLLAALGGWAIQRQAAAAAARASAAEQKAQAAVAAANEQLAAVREQSEKQLAEAREGAIRAQAVSDVLAAPDLTRFPIAGSGPNGISGQLLWSRTRGVVFSAVRLPPVAAGMTYQLWLLTDGLPVTAGTFDPGASGRVTFTAAPPRVPRPVIGVALTLEPAGGSSTPSEMLVQNRAVRPAPQE